MITGAIRTMYDYRSHKGICVITGAIIRAVCDYMSHEGHVCLQEP